MDIRGIHIFFEFIDEQLKQATTKEELSRKSLDTILQSKREIFEQSIHDCINENREFKGALVEIVANIDKRLKRVLKIHSGLSLRQSELRPARQEHMNELKKQQTPISSKNSTVSLPHKTKEVLEYDRLSLKQGHLHIIREHLGKAKKFAQLAALTPIISSNYEKTSSNEGANNTFFNNCRFKDDIGRIKTLYQNLVNGGYIPKETPLDDFIYYFSGSGNTPSCKLKWCKPKIQLAIFIAQIHTDDAPNIWAKAENIFEEVNRKSLCQQYSSAMNTSKSISDKIDNIKSLL